MTTKLSTQEIASILIEELERLEDCSRMMVEVETNFRDHLIQFQLTSDECVGSLNHVMSRKINVDTTPIVNILEQKQTVPRWAFWTLILQPLAIALITSILVWLYIDNTERTAWSDGYNFAKQEQIEPTK